MYWEACHLVLNFYWRGYITDSHVSTVFLHSTQYTVHSTQYTVHSTQYTVHSTQYTVHSTQYTVHSTQYTVHSTQYTVHSTQYTVHSTQYTVHSTQYTVHSTQYTVHSTQYKAKMTKTADVLAYQEYFHVFTQIFSGLNTPKLHDFRFRQIFGAPNIAKNLGVVRAGWGGVGIGWLGEVTPQPTTYHHVFPPLRPTW